MRKCSCRFSPDEYGLSEHVRHHEAALARRRRQLAFARWTMPLALLANFAVVELGRWSLFILTIPLFLFGLVTWMTEADARTTVGDHELQLLRARRWHIDDTFRELDAP